MVVSEMSSRPWKVSENPVTLTSLLSSRETKAPVQVMSEIGVLCLLFAAEEGAAAFLADALPFWARFRLCLRAGIVKIAKEKMEGEGGQKHKIACTGSRWGQVLQRESKVE